MSAIAQLKNARISPRKAQPVAALVRGRSLADALVILDHTPRRAAGYIAKAIKSAGANAERNHNYKPDSLYVDEISITPALRYKRWRPTSRGRPHPFQKANCHIRVVVEGEKRQVK